MIILPTIFDFLIFNEYWLIREGYGDKGMFCNENPRFSSLVVQGYPCIKFV
ncbi:hypothetical protein DOT_0097 [Desulfosporosinus sp. OT]|nr:hypothetical protein DOT_0097 [Desulfosporosinus sp. OT]